MPLLRDTIIPPSKGILNFTKLLDKLLDGSKTQTIRKPRKRPLELGDLLHLYWRNRTPHSHKLGYAIITDLKRKPFCEISAHDFKLDGFGDKATEKLESNLTSEAITSLGCLYGLLNKQAISILSEAVLAFVEIYPELSDVTNWRNEFVIITFQPIGRLKPPPNYEKERI